MAANNPSLRAEALITDYLEQLVAGKQVNFDDLRLANPDIADFLHQALQARLGKTVNSDPAATMATQFSVDPVSGDSVAADPVAEDPVLIQAAPRYPETRSRVGRMSYVGHLHADDSPRWPPVLPIQA
ncbi:MAG: hypothetical protein ACI8UD_001121 [Planctomycetota bacterium]|jgi:hypothetical protein